MCLANLVPPMLVGGEVSTCVFLFLFLLETRAGQTEALEVVLCQRPVVWLLQSPLSKTTFCFSNHHAEEALFFWLIASCVLSHLTVALGALNSLSK